MQLQKQSSSTPSQARPMPQASAEVLHAVRMRVQRACAHRNLEPKESRAAVYECADCGYQARSTFGHVTRWRDDA